ncbi:MAG: PEP-CTERM sorting domain-containing protein [Sedimentisphaerales bacterium]|nr:PEP-CTERM sorting domain-containing protein [Sedimentisphaerales bacterium]
MKRLLTFCTILTLMLAVSAQAALVAPDSILASGIAMHKAGAPVTLPAPGDYKWWYGCAPTSAGMVMGYYDVQGYNGMSLGNLVPGGQAENSTYGAGPYLANNAIASSGHINDFYSGGYGASGDDVSPPWHSFDCLADFMGASQDSVGNPNGATGFFYYLNGAPLTSDNIISHGLTEESGMYGIREYIEYRGYQVESLYNQYIDTQELDFGFTFAQYMAEIDAGRPVLIHIDNHSMFGYGYDAANNSVLLHDTWTSGQHAMTWGGYYDGKEHYGVTVLTVVPEPATIALLAFGALTLIRKRNK